MEKNTRMFDDHFHLTVDQITTYVNEAIKTDTSIIDENEDMNKWITLPSVLLDSNNNQDKFIETVVYIDELMIAKEKKITLINTLASLLINTQVKISDIDVDSLYLLVSYFNDVPQREYIEQYKLLGDMELLKVIRYTTLDLEKRIKLVQYIVDQARNDNINFDDTQKMSEFKDQVIKVLKEKTADEILGIENYLNGKVTKVVDFRDSLNA